MKEEKEENQCLWPKSQLLDFCSLFYELYTQDIIYLFTLFEANSFSTAAPNELKLE